MMEMAYNLPAAWDQGFVLPKNALDEGLERRGFVTKQMPRGTYDQPEVGTGGYKVPRYVLDEGYGQGTFTTKWQPSGSYSGPKVPNWLNRRPQVVRTKRLPGGAKVVTVQPLNGDDDAIPATYQDYGAKAAQVIISQVSRLPVRSRPAAMKALLAKIDKSLWSRTSDIWKRYVSQGVAPDQAFPMALARAMAAGFSAEIVDMGLRRKAPQVNSLLGLGCYGLCGAPLSLGYLLTEEGGGSTGGSTGGSYPSVPLPPKPVVHDGGVIPVTPPVDDSGIKVFYVGGFPFRGDVPIKTWVSSNATANDNGRARPPLFQVEHPDGMSADQIAFLTKYLTEEVNANGKSDQMVHYNATSSEPYYREPDAEFWFSKLGIQQDVGVRFQNLRALRLATSPVAWTVHPTTGDNLAMHVTLARLDMAKDYNVVSNPLVLKAWISKMPSPNWWTSLLQTVVKLPITLDPTGSVEAVQDAVGKATKVVIDIHDAIRDAIHKLTCEVLNSKEGETAGAAVAAYYGAPPQVGVEGVKTAASLCPGGGQPLPLPPIPVAKPSMLPVVLLAGGGVLAALLLLQPKKKKT
jgi:hypothetical protein